MYSKILIYLFTNIRSAHVFLLSRESLVGQANAGRSTARVRQIAVVRARYHG